MFVGREVRTAGYVYEMCTDMGCWIALLPAVDSGRMIKIAWAQTDVRFPMGEETDGHWVELQGKVITAEQEAADHEAHMAEEGGEHAEHEHTEMMDTRTVYVCPMHADATSEEPGICEACGGMELQPKEVAVPTYGGIAIEGIGAIVKEKK
ncbi:heavy metal-binding domain-containing protein [Gemmatimonadota bacterium]